MTLAEAHIEAQRRLREFAENAIATVWHRLPGYDEEHVDPFVASIAPIILATQRQSVSVTDAFLAAALQRRPLGVPREEASGSAARAGAEPEHVYRRPFVTVWTALQAGTEWEQAVAQGLNRARSIAATDVQLAMRRTLQSVGERDEGLMGFKRVANPGACSFCLTVNGAQFRKQDPMPLHPLCGCGVEPVPYARGARFKPDPMPEGVAVRDHGELGPTLGDPSHSFTAAGDLA